MWPLSTAATAVRQGFQRALVEGPTPTDVAVRSGVTSSRLLTARRRSGGIKFACWFRAVLNGEASGLVPEVLHHCVRCSPLIPDVATHSDYCSDLPVRADPSAGAIRKRSTIITISSAAEEPRPSPAPPERTPTVVPTGLGDRGRVLSVRPDTCRGQLRYYMPGTAGTERGRPGHTWSDEPRYPAG